MRTTLVLGYMNLSLRVSSIKRNLLSAAWVRAVKEVGHKQGISTRDFRFKINKRNRRKQCQSSELMRDRMLQNIMSMLLMKMAFCPLISSLISKRRLQNSVTSWQKTKVWSTIKSVLRKPTSVKRSWRKQFLRSLGSIIIRRERLFRGLTWKTKSLMVSKLRNL